MALKTPEDEGWNSDDDVKTSACKLQENEVQDLEGMRFAEAMVNSARHEKRSQKMHLDMVNSIKKHHTRLDQVSQHGALALGKGLSEQ